VPKNRTTLCVLYIDVYIRVLARAHTYTHAHFEIVSISSHASPPHMERLQRNVNTLRAQRHENTLCLLYMDVYISILAHAQLTHMHILRVFHFLTYITSTHEVRIKKCEKLMHA